MPSATLFVGTQDIDFISTKMPYASSVTSQTVAPDSTTTHFRSSFVPSCISIYTNYNTAGDAFIKSKGNFSSSSFWTTFRLFTNNIEGGSPASNSNIKPFVLYSNDGVIRLRIRFNGSGTVPTGNFVVEKVNAAGTATALGSASIGSYANGWGGLDKLDIFVNYAVSGQFTVYLNGAQTFTYSGDVTTDSITSLSDIGLGNAAGSPSNGSSTIAYYSEVICSTNDTRQMSLHVATPSANGNTHNFDAGTAANAASLSYSTGDSNPQTSGTAGQIDQYQISPSIPSNPYTIQSVVIKARAVAGAAGPQHMDTSLHIGGIDYSSTDIAVSNSGFDTYQTIYDTNPNTGVAWTTSDIIANSTAYSIGVKSVT